MPEQDSAIQAAVSYPAVIADTHQADTFNLSEAPDSFTVLRGSLRGETGHPLPYSLRIDNPLTVSLLVCLCLYLVLIGRYASSLVRMLKNFFFVNRTGDTDMSATEVRVLIIFSILNCAMLSMATYFFFIQAPHLPMASDSAFQPIAIMTGLYMAYFLLKWGLYTLVNLEFFGKKKNLHWIQSLLFLTSCEGILLFPVIILLFYFDISIKISVVFCIFVLFLNKILTFSKALQNFFRQNGGYLQTFLYFCALEIITTLAFGGVIQVLIDAFTIKF